MKWDRGTLVAALFILLSIGSAVYLSAITLNYLNYYPSLGQIQLRVDSAFIVQGSNQSRIDSRVTIVNPTSYAGFKLGNAIVFISFSVKDSNITLFVGGTRPTENSVIGGQLGPYSSVSHDVIVQLNTEDASSFRSFNSSYGGRVIVKVELTVEVITFLDPVTGLDYYTDTEYHPLSSG